VTPVSYVFNISKWLSCVCICARAFKTKIPWHSSNNTVWWVGNLTSKWFRHVVEKASVSFHTAHSKGRLDYSTNVSLLASQRANAPVSQSISQPAIQLVNQSYRFSVCQSSIQPISVPLIRHSTILVLVFLRTSSVFCLSALLSDHSISLT